MGLDVYLYDAEEKDLTIAGFLAIHNHRKELFHNHITHNLTEMAREAGLYEFLWYPETVGVQTAADIIEPLANALPLLVKDPERFKKLEPENGWGTYEYFVEFVEKYFIACFKYRDAIVRAER